MKKPIVAMVMVGGKGKRLRSITKLTAKPAVSFLGKYRMIDFTLSNLVNSGIDTVGILIQYEPYEIMDYIGNGASWDLDVNNGGINFLTPYISSGDKINWQQGTAHAVLQHFNFLNDYDPDYVLILPGDHIYKMDYRLMLKAHKENNADLTIATKYITGDVSRFGVLETLDEKIIDFKEKPEGMIDGEISMGIYLFNKKALLDILNEFPVDEPLDFGQNVIPLLVKKGRTYRYLFTGYFQDVGTVESLYLANMELLDHPELMNLNDSRDFMIYSRSFNLPPHMILEDGSLRNIIVSDGTIINGTAKHSVIGYRGYLGKNAMIENVVALDNVYISDGAIIKNAIINKNIKIPACFVKDDDKLALIDDEYLGGRDDD